MTSSGIDPGTGELRASDPGSPGDAIELSRANVLTEGYKGLLLVNGGGAAALLAFLQATWEKSPELARPTLVGIALMASGLCFALLVPFFRYHHSHWAQRKRQQEHKGSFKSIYWILYISCQYASVVSFIVGVGYLVIAAWPLVKERPA